MKAVNAEAEKYYVAGRDPYAERRTEPETSSTPANGDEEGL
jgi:hypothetical protein